MSIKCWKILFYLRFSWSAKIWGNVRKVPQTYRSSNMRNLRYLPACGRQIKNLPNLTPISSATRAATDMAATLRGWVQPIFIETVSPSSFFRFGGGHIMSIECDGAFWFHWKLASFVWWEQMEGKWRSEKRLGGEFYCPVSLLWWHHSVVHVVAAITSTAFHWAAVE